MNEGGTPETPLGGVERKRTVLIDALGTMVWLEPPWERIDPEAVAGVEPDRVKAAFMAEIAYYMDHIDEGSDPEGLADLRRRCAEVLSREAGVEIPVETMLDAIRFQPFPDTIPALQALRAAGLKVVCVSNWDCSLPGVLDDLGLTPLLDGVVNSAATGARKPDPAIFEAGLELAGCSAAEAIHVGDSDDDVTGAEAAGIEVVRIDRAGSGEGPGGNARITSLSELQGVLQLAGGPQPPPVAADTRDSRPPPPASPSAPPPGAGGGPDDRVPTGEGYTGVPRTAVHGIHILVGVLIAFGILLMGAVLVGLFDPTVRDTGGEEFSTGGALVSQLFTVAGMLLAAVLYTASRNKEDWKGALRRLGVRAAPIGKILGWAGLGLIAYLVSAAIITSLLSPEQEDIAENLGASADSELIATILAGLLIIVGAAVGEEVMFRGFVFGGLRQTMSLWPAALISGVVFGALHLTAGNVAVAVQLSIFGVILAWLYERTGSLWTPMLLHGFNNAVAFTLLITDTI